MDKVKIKHRTEYSIVILFYFYIFNAIVFPYMNPNLWRYYGNPRMSQLQCRPIALQRCSVLVDSMRKVRTGKLVVEDF